MPPSSMVSVIMPIRNEVSFIRQSLGAILTQDYPRSNLEILIVDGMSDDGTRERIQQVVTAYADTIVRVIDNPFRTVPHALNMALREAEGSIVIRIDGHCEIPPHYIRTCLETLDRTRADCVGGCLKTVGKTRGARAIAIAQSSVFGVGNVAFRTGRSAEGYVDTVAFGAYRREVFQRIGGFDEELIRNQDDEFNFRLTQSGGKIWLDPSIEVVYYSRASLTTLWRQYFQYGFYKVRVIQKHRAIPSWRHLVPATLVVGILVSVLAGWMAGDVLWTIFWMGPYLGAILFASVWEGRKEWRVVPLLPLAFITLHVSYGSGFLWGLWRWRGEGHVEASQQENHS